MGGPVKLVTMMTILLRPFQNVENAGQQLLLRSVETSTGEVLTQIGKIVGQEREGITDDEIFRRYVRTKVAANKSSMIGDDILLVAKLFFGDGVDLDANNVGDASYELGISGVDVTPDLAQRFADNFLRIATGTAIAYEITTSSAPSASTFTFGDDVNNETIVGAGWGDDVNSPAVGGVFASANGAS